MENVFSCYVTHRMQNARIPVNFLSSPMNSESDVNQLAGRIQRGISENGVHVLDEEELAPIMAGEDERSDAERRMHLENFAQAHGFDVHFSVYLKVAIFRKLPAPGNETTGTNATA